jgi:hypothetical protein
VGCFHFVHDGMTVSLYPFMLNDAYVEHAVQCKNRQMSCKYICSYAAAIECVVFCTSVWAFNPGSRGVNSDLLCLLHISEI